MPRTAPLARLAVGPLALCCSLYAVGCGGGGSGDQQREVACGDAADDDGDGDVDCDDSDCRLTTECGGGDPAAEDCANSTDDDGDGLADCADTEDCGALPACQGSGGELCDNQVDDDGDGDVDCDDAQCAGSTACPSEDACDDLTDNDGDGDVDCDDEDCFFDLACDLGGGVGSGGATSCAGTILTGVAGSNSGDTTSGVSDAIGSCVGEGQKEQIIAFTPAVTGTMTLTLTSAVDLGVYVRTTCTDGASELVDGCIDIELGGAEGGAPEVLEVAVTAGQPLSIFVDGFDDGTGATINGPYTLDIAVQ